MGIENFIKDALHKPNDYTAYHVGRKLTELNPEKTVVAGQSWYFELEAFVRAGHCSITEKKSVFHQLKTEWIGTGRKLRNSIENSWVNVLWKGHLMDVVLITWAESSCRRRYHWIIADGNKSLKTSSARCVSGRVKCVARSLSTTTATFEKTSSSSTQSRVPLSKT